MISFWSIALLLMSIILGLLVIFMRYQKPIELKISRDEANKRYYKHRLNELVYDEESGIISEKEAFVRELQRNLLKDIPLEQQGKELTNKKSDGLLLFWVITGVLVVFSAVYAKNNNLMLMTQWQRSVERYPELLVRYNTTGIKKEELSIFMLGLRNQLVIKPDDLHVLLALAAVAIDTNDLSIATQALSHAYRLAPNDGTVLAHYGKLLLYSTTVEDKQLGRELLNRSYQQDPKNLDVIKTIAFAALEAKDYHQSLTYWKIWLDVATKNEPNRILIERTVNSIKEKLTIAKNNTN